MGQSIAFTIVMEKNLIFLACVSFFKFPNSFRCGSSFYDFFFAFLYDYIPNSSSKYSVSVYLSATSIRIPDFFK